MGSNEASDRMVRVHELAQTVTLYGTPILLVAICAYLMVVAFSAGGQVWVQSLSGLLLPVIFGSYLYLFKRAALLFIAKLTPGIGFGLGVVMGVVVMGALRLFQGRTFIPIPEMLTSGCFSVLVFSAAAKEDDSCIALFYGVICGALAYTIILGFPDLVMRLRPGI